MYNNNISFFFYCWVRYFWVHSQVHIATMSALDCLMSHLNQEDYENCPQCNPAAMNQTRRKTEEEDEKDEEDEEEKFWPVTWSESRGTD